MAILSRLFIGLIGILSVITAGQHWFSIDGMMAERGIYATNLLGRANFRADIGGIFIGIGSFAIIAAVKQDRDWLLAAILLTSAALLGRFASIAIDGYDDPVLMPIIIEIIVISSMLIAYNLWRKAPEGL